MPQPAGGPQRPTGGQRAQQPQRLSFRQIGVKSVFKGAVNKKLDGFSQNVPAAGNLKNNSTFQNGLDKFATDFARQPGAAQNPGRAAFGAAMQNVGEGMAKLPDLAASGIARGFNALLGNGGGGAPNNQSDPFQH